MDTLATARKLQQAGLPLEHAQTITEAIQDGTSAVPSSLELRNFVLNINGNIEQLRSEMQAECGRIHARLERLDTRLDDQDRRLSRIERRLDDLRIPPIMGSLVTTMLLVIIAGLVLYGVLR